MHRQDVEQLGVSRQAVRQRIDAGTLSARRFGKAYAVPSAAVSRAVQTSQEHVANGEGFKAVQAAARAAGPAPGRSCHRGGAPTSKITKAK